MMVCMCMMHYDDDDDDDDDGGDEGDHGVHNHINESMINDKKTYCST
jgi:hypothetical protein